MPNFLIVALLSTLTGIIGYLVGHFLAIGRNRRNEFNEVAKPITLKLLQQIEILEQGRFVESCINDEDFRELGLYFNKRKSIRYTADLKEYKKSIVNSGQYGRGGYHIKDLLSYIKASHKMLSYAKRK